MRSTRALMLLVIFSACASRTAPPPSGPSAGAAAGTSEISEISLRSHMEFLASDALNGRASGSRDEWIAVSYVASQLLKWGLEPLGDSGGYVQTIDIERPQLAAPPTLSAGGRRYVHGKEISVAVMVAPQIAGPLARYESHV